MQQNQEHNRLVWIDCLRLMAGISMLILHATSDPNGQPWTGFSVADRWPPLLLRAVVYIARTELFLLISFFLLLLSLDNRPRGYVETLQEQARRLLIPFAFWTLFYAFYGGLKAWNFGYLTTYVNDVLTVQAWLGFALLGDVKYHMHFLPTLMGVLLFFPLFRLSIRYPMVGGLVVFFLLIRQAFDAFLYQNFWNEPWLPFAIRGAKILSYVGYGVAAGAMLGLWQKLPQTKLLPWVSMLCCCGAMLFVIKLFSTYRVVQTGTWDFSYVPGYWADYLLPLILFAVFLCLGGKHWPPRISRWAKYAFGIYLCHPIFLDMSEIVLKNLGFDPIVQVASAIAITLPMTIVFVLCLTQIRWLGWSIGLGPLPSFNLRTPITKKAG